MEYLKFIPEGWENANEGFSKNDLERAMNDKCILQGVVENCDLNYNLHVNFFIIKYNGGSYERKVNF